MHPPAPAGTEVEPTEWRQGRDAELAGAKILACPYPDGAQARRWREGWTASSRTAPTRYASGPGGYTSRFAEPPPLPDAAEVPAAVAAARASLRSKECPVCGGAKVQDTMFCVRCRGALPCGAFLVLGALGREEDRARWWQQSCADLRGE